VQFQQSFKEVVSFVPVFLVASMLRKGGGGAVDTHSDRAREEKKKKKKKGGKKTTSERTTASVARLTINAQRAPHPNPR